jgi:hypothetical protein
MSDEPKIAWNKYEWPYLRKEEEEEEYAENDMSLPYLQVEEGALPNPRNTKAAKFLFTQHGIIAVDELTNPNRVFNTWIGHTNFDLTKKVERVIEEVRGVETLDVLTRYRFRVAIGLMFKQRDVRLDIQKAVYKIAE